MLLLFRWRSAESKNLAFLRFAARSFHAKDRRTKIGKDLGAGGPGSNRGEIDY